MRQVTIYDTPHYRVVSVGNGLAYLFQNKSASTEIFFQDSDATTFGQEIDAWENQHPDKLTDEILGEIWSNYSELALPIEWPAMKTLSMNDNGNGTVTVLGPDGRDLVTLKCVSRKGPWRGNNRRTDLWFTYEGAKYWGWCDESRTVFTAHQIKGGN
jgi:hypothetical protein